MELKTIHCFLVHPSKHQETPPELGGALVRTRGKLYDMLNGIFQKADSDCKIEIAFCHNADGQQQNDCRDLFAAYLHNHRMEEARNIASRLQAVTTQKSGLGLLFVMLGDNGTHWRLMLSRFPADQGILAEERKDTLTVEFLEKVFMKSATSYKAAFYGGPRASFDFWLGKAIDKQINHQGDNLARYWIEAFLASSLRTTAAAGTKRLATALRAALKGVSDPQAKAEISASITLAPSLNGQTTSVFEFCGRFGLSERAKQAVNDAVVHENLATESFQFDAEEFHKHIAYRSVEIDNGGILTAEAARFNDVFQREDDLGDGSIVKFSTQGRIVDERFRKSKT